MSWYHSYNWKENPFSIKTSTNLVGIEKQKRLLLNYITSGDICFLSGPTGSGKTSLLKWVNKYLKKHTILYLDASTVKESFSLAQLLKKQNSFWNKLTRKSYPDDTVILLDESQDGSPELIKALKYHWDNNNIKSLVITQISPDLGSYSESFQDRIGNRKITLSKISKADAVDLVKIRTNNNNPFDNEALEKIMEYSNLIPRRFLETCELICISLEHQAGKPINVYEVEKILGEKQVKIDTSKLSPELKAFSPMQQHIIQLLSESDKTTQELAQLLDTSEGSVGKQLSKLAQLDIVRVTSEKRPKKYSLIKGKRKTFEPFKEDPRIKEVAPPA